LWKKYKDQLEFVPRQFFDLAHPITKTELSIDEFYGEMFKLVRANYSKKRWLISKSKSLANKFLSVNKYPLKQTISANVLSIAILNFIYTKEFSKEKLLAFQNEMSQL